MSIPRPGWRTLAVVLAGAGALHFLRPRPYASIVPDVLGDPYPWVYASGVAQLACAAALVPARTRRPAALATMLLFVAVFPANVQMAVDALTSDRASAAYRALTVIRLPLQVPLVLWALAVARRARRLRVPDRGPAPDREPAPDGEPVPDGEPRATPDATSEAPR